VRVAVLESAQDCLRSKRLFVAATFFCVCWRVQYGFLRTCGTWLYVETDGMCMCKHVSTAIFLHKNQKKAMNSAMRSGTSMAHSDKIRPTQPSPNRPYKQFYQNKNPKQNNLNNHQKHPPLQRSSDIKKGCSDRTLRALCLFLRVSNKQAFPSVVTTPKNRYYVVRCSMKKYDI
jgi:hypothetical protein